MSTNKLLELINEFSKGAGYKISTQISVAFLRINNEQSEKIKCLGVNLTKEVKD